MRENPQSTLGAEIIQEFMEFYRLNYSIAIFGPEANLKSKTPDRKELAQKAGVDASEDKPILLQILDALSLGGGAKAAKPADAGLRDTSVKVPQMPDVKP